MTTQPSTPTSRHKRQSKPYPTRASTSKASGSKRTFTRPETFAQWKARGSMPPTPSPAKTEPPPEQALLPSPTITPNDNSPATRSQRRLFTDSGTSQTSSSSLSPGDGIDENADELLKFLQSCKPRMDRLLPAFLGFGCSSLEHLSAAADWKHDDIDAFLMSLVLPQGCGQPISKMEALILRHHLIKFFKEVPGK